jgi:hypothetical protein
MRLEENDLHDWYIDGIALGPSEITLLVHLDDARKKIELTGVTRCLLNNLLMTNIIYAAKIASAEDEPELYQSEIARLDTSYPAKWANGTARRILSISASVGLEGIIEFDVLKIRDF